MIGGRQLQDLSLVSENQKSVTLGKTPVGSVSVKKNVGNLTTVTNADVLRLIVGKEPTPYCLLKLSENDNPDIILNPGGGPIELPRVEEINADEGSNMIETESLPEKQTAIPDNPNQNTETSEALVEEPPKQVADEDPQEQVAVKPVAVEQVAEERVAEKPVAEEKVAVEQVTEKPVAVKLDLGQSVSNPSVNPESESPSVNESIAGGSRNRKKTHIKRTKKNKTIKKRYIQQGGLKANVLMFNRNGERCVNGNVYTDKELSKGIYNGQTVSNLEPLTTYSRNTGKPCSGNWTKMFPIEAGPSGPSGDTGSGSSGEITINSKTVEEGINKFTKAMGSAGINLSGTTETDGTKRKSGKKGKEKQSKGYEMGSEQFNGDIEEGEVNNSLGSESMGYGYGMGMGGMPERNTIHYQSHSADAGKGKTSGKDKSKGKSKSKSIAKTGQPLAQSRVGTQAGTQAGTQLGTQAGTPAGTQAVRKIKGINLGVKKKVAKMASASSQPISMNMSSQPGAKPTESGPQGETGAPGAKPPESGATPPPEAQAKEAPASGPSQSDKGPGAQGAEKGKGTGEKGKGPAAQGADKGDKGPVAQGADKGDKGPGEKGKGPGEKGKGPDKTKEAKRKRKRTKKKRGPEGKQGKNKSLIDKLKLKLRRGGRK